MNYQKWNRALLDHFFPQVEEEGARHLCVDPTRLLIVAEETGYADFADEKAATRSLFDAATKAFRSILGGGTPPQPDIAPLAALVLIYGELGDDSGRLHPQDFWSRVGRDLNGGRKPTNKEKERLTGRWGLLRRFLEQNGHGTLYKPPAHILNRRHVDSIGCQALLRICDIRDIFEQLYGYGCHRHQPLLENRISQLHVDALKAHARRVLEESENNLARREAALRQIRQEWLEWDWQRQRPSPRTNAIREVELSLHVSRRRRETKLIGHLVRHEGDHIDLSAKALKKILRADGRLAPLKFGGLQYRPHPARDCLLLVDCGSYTLTRRWCQVGDKVLFAARAGSRHWQSLPVADRDTVKRWTSPQQTAEGWEPLPGLPVGWRLAQFTVGSVEPSESWRPLIRGSVRLRCEGGLRLDRRSYMAGCGPTILVETISGVLAPSQVLVDGESVPVEVGRVRADTLDRPGTHTVEAATARLLILVAEAEVGETSAWAAVRDESGWPTDEPRLWADGLSSVDGMSPAMVGPAVVGQWPPLHVPRATAPSAPAQPAASDHRADARMAVRLLVAGPAIRASLQSNHPLVQVLQRSTPKRG